MKKIVIVILLLLGLSSCSNTSQLSDMPATESFKENCQRVAEFFSSGDNPFGYSDFEVVFWFKDPDISDMSDKKNTKEFLWNQIGLAKTLAEQTNRYSGKTEFPEEYIQSLLALQEEILAVPTDAFNYPESLLLAYDAVSRFCVPKVKDSPSVNPGEVTTLPISNPEDSVNSQVCSEYRRVMSRIFTLPFNDPIITILYQDVIEYAANNALGDLLLYFRVIYQGVGDTSIAIIEIDKICSGLGYE